MTSPDGAGIPAGATGSPVGAWGDDASFGATTDALVEGFPNFIGFFIALALKALGDLVGGIPFVGDALEDILDGIAGLLIDTRDTAVAAQETAETANTNAGTALTDSAGALLKATDAKLMAIGTYNYVENYGFEDSGMRAAFPPPNANWSYVNNGANAHSGTWYAKLEPPPGGFGAYDNFFVSENIPTVPGDRFYVEWWQQRRSANFPAMLFVYYFDKDDNILDPGYQTVPGPTAENNTWVKYSFTTPLVAPAGTTYTRALLRMQITDPYEVQDVVLDHGAAGYSSTAKMGTKSLAGTGVWKGSTAADFISSTGLDGGNLTAGTVECWFKIPTVSAQRNILGVPYWFEINVSAAHKLMINVGTAGAVGTWPTATASSTASVDDNAWHHAALVFEAGNYRLYLDGTQVASGTGPFKAGPADANIPGRFWFGGLPSTTTYDWCANGGLIDALRISYNVRYTGSSFTPPTSYTVDGNTSAIFDMENDTMRTVAASGAWWFDDLVVKKVDRGLEPRVTALEGGGTRTVYTSTSVFANPGTGTYGAALIGGGYGGQGPGTTPLNSVKSGGTHGGYLYRELNCADLAPTLALVVGAAGAANGGAGTRTALYEWTGSALGVLYATSVEGNVGSILTRQGAVASSSTPGKGGDANGNGTGPGQSGASTALATGGAGGPAANAGDGAAGGSVSTSEPTPCGGAGGGAGGSFGGAFSRPGHGGAGGSPGGGGGGAGAKDTLNAGAVSNGGPGAPGRAIILWRPA